MRRLLLIACSVVAFGAACVTAVPPIQRDVDAPPGSLRVAMVTNVATETELTQAPELREILHSAGVPDQDIVAGSITQVAVHCCGGPEDINSEVVFVPSGIQVQRGDIVEIRVARGPQAPGLERLNVVTQVREVHDTEPPRCHWIPPDLWRRTLYCDWMREEGWVEVRSLGLPVLWMKPPDRAP